MLNSVNYSHTITQFNQNLQFQAFLLSTKVQGHKGTYSISISKDILPPKGQLKLFFPSYLEIITKELYVCIQSSEKFTGNSLKDRKEF